MTDVACDLGVSERIPASLGHVMSRGTVALPSVAWYFHPMSFTATTSMARAKRVAAAVHRCRPRVRRLAVHVDVHAARRLSGARPKRVSPLTSDVAPPVLAHAATARTRAKSSAA